MTYTVMLDGVRHYVTIVCGPEKFQGPWVATTLCDGLIVAGATTDRAEVLLTQELQAPTCIACMAMCGP